MSRPGSPTRSGRTHAQIRSAGNAGVRPKDPRPAGRGEAHQTRIADLVTSTRPDLLELVGVGPIIAATALVVWSHPGRIHSDRAFAMMDSVAPLPASSGPPDIGSTGAGDRHLNSALHVVAIQRQRHDPATKAYFEDRCAEGRCAEGKTDREIRRCLKRYIALQIYRTLESGLDRQ
ncbi:MAG: transposase [Ilumatobacter sp.]|uniref:transposase n=1 Tax=Ilumatobacter sp. TaxID=1967498 RepID=UPI00391DE9AF